MYCGHDGARPPLQGTTTPKECSPLVPFLTTPRRPCHATVKKKTQAEPAATPAPEAAAPAPAPAAASGDAIYLGFPKGDYDRSAGRTGRVIRDDPKKYPAKENVGGFTGAVGGWAGGEAGLWQLRDEVKAQEAADKAASKAEREAKEAARAAEQRVLAAAAAADKAERAAKAAKAAGAASAAPIYLGYGKGEVRDTEPGRVIVDDPRKYPAKEDVLGLSGAVGGWAGGERGLKQFVRDGEVVLREPGQPGGSQFSPVAVAALVVVGAAGGGLLLNGAVDVGETVVRSEIVNAPIDAQTRALLLAAVAILGGGGAVAAGLAAVKSLQARVAGGATKLALTGAFWVGVFFAARAVLEL